MSGRNVYEQLMSTARSKLLGTTSSTDRAIVGIYRRAAADLAERAGSAKPGGLTERWASDYSASLSERMAEMRGEVGGVIRGAMRTSAQLPVTATEDWLTAALKRGGVDGSFRGALPSTPDDALRALLNGKRYRDGKTLSKRIWSHTGRLQLGIEEVVAQGIAQKRSAYHIAKDLEAYLNPEAAVPYDWRNVYPDIPFPLRVDYNAQRLARTAINQAYWAANLEAAKCNPMCTAIHWALSPSHYERQVAPHGEDECDVYAAHDEGLGVGNWSTSSLPMPHPQCLCIQYQVVPDSLDAVADKLTSWIDGGDDPAMDAGFAQWRKERGL